MAGRVHTLNTYCLHLAFIRVPHDGVIVVDDKHRCEVYHQSLRVWNILTSVCACITAPNTMDPCPCAYPTPFCVMKLEGCEVVVKCGGKSMREYETTVSEDGKVVSCFIASQPGKRKVTGEIWLSRHEDKFYNYEFSRPELIEGETPSSTDPESIGEIEVRVGFVASSEKVERCDKRLLDLGPSKINKKDKMPGAHCAGPMSEVQAEDCLEGAGEVFFGSVPHEDALLFRFICRAEAWLQAEEIMRKPRRRGGFEPVEDSEVSPLLKPERVKEEVLAGRTTALSVVRSRPRPRSPTPPGYTDEDPSILERPRKIPRRSGRFASTGGSGTVTTGGNNLPSQAKLEEGGSVPKIKGEARELKVNELGGLKAEEMKPDAQILKLEEKRAKIPPSRTGRGVRSSQPKVKAEREPTTVPKTPIR